MNRRSLLRTAFLLPALGAEGQRESSPAALIDCNVWLGEHPGRVLPWHGEDAVAGALRARGVTQALAGTFDLLLHKDPASANKRLADECAASGGLLLPAGAINPKLPAWQEDIVRCADEHGMKAIRLLPGYHGYGLDEPVFDQVLELAVKHSLLVQLVAQMEDERTQHPLLRVPPVEFKPLSGTLQKHPQAKVMVLNASRAMTMQGLRGCSVWVDTAMLEGVGSIESLLKDWPLDRLVFGSHSPFFYWEAARLKLQESALSASQLAAIMHGNAESLI